MHKLAEKGDVTIFARADLKFHETICTLSGNERLHAMFLRYVPLLYSLIKLDEFLYSSMDEVAEDHVPMLEAVESGDAALAARLFEEHADRAQNLVVSYLEEQSQDRGRGGARARAGADESGVVSETPAGLTLSQRAAPPLPRPRRVAGHEGARPVLEHRLRVVRRRRPVRPGDPARGLLVQRLDLGVAAAARASRPSGTARSWTTR